jgi:endonuclease/exonuclease/phosphatase (EEP) superfamily protein YafD
MNYAPLLILLYAALSLWALLDSQSLLADLAGQATLHSVVAFSLLATFLLVKKQRLAGCGLLVIASLNLLWVWYSLYHATPASHEDALRVLSYNVFIDNKDFDAVISIITDADAEVVWLHEVSHELYAHISHRLRKDYPYIYPDTIKTKGSILLTKMPHQIHEVNRHGYFLKHATLVMDDRNIDVVGVHLTSPKSNERVQSRNEQFGIVQDYITKNVRPEQLLVIAGDFNSAPWRPAFVNFSKDTGFKHGSYEVLPSWPSFSIYPLSFPIDHVLTRDGLCIADKAVLGSGGSDHYPILANLTYCK